MKTHNLHSWNVSLENALAIQKNLRAWIITEGQCPSPRLVGRISLLSSAESDESTTVQACITVVEAATQRLLERKVAIKATAFPLHAGLYSFRTMPAVVAALNKLKRVPDVFICDGRGITGEDRFGVASHVGLVTSVPTIGIRSVRPKHISGTLSAERGSFLRVSEGGQVAAVLRVLEGVDPILVSPAHRVSMEEAVARILEYIPETTSIREYLQAIYPEAGHTSETPVQLRLVKSAAGR
ncbi:endonuclease V [Ketobacter sp.]|uniref:endonuclease V n=1 Tax=Ketobacter sp. TaxID=2083498 RepID=UPI000F215BBC|nr:endonuclease V [Ketobacter sp.]RLT98050.1 MAG: hypothetical protein D9N14_10485 [Ketobacter sp.]